MMDTAKSSADGVDRQACDDLAIHTPGAIQGHGMLAAFDLVTKRLTHVSANMTQLLSAPSQGDELGDIVRALGLPPGLDGKTVAKNLAFTDQSGQSAYAHGHPTGDHYIVEVEPAVPVISSDISAQMTDLMAATTWPDFSEQMVDVLSTIFGYARTMAYVLHPDAHGEVTCERLARPGLEPYLGLHYPATDIPQQARRLSVLQPVRVIADVDGSVADLLRWSPTEPSGEVIDLTFATLRAVAPVHLEYLRNMGVATSAAISVARNDQLAAMFVMHDDVPRHLSVHDREGLSALSRVASFAFTTIDERKFYNRRSEVSRLSGALGSRIASAGSPIDPFEEFASSVLDAARADGLVARIGGQIFSAGLTPPTDAVDRVARKSSAAAEPLIQLSTQLSVDLPELAVEDEVGGAAIKRLLSAEETYLAWFRRPQISTVRWAGAPTLVRQDELGRLHPRASFAEFVEHAADRATDWDHHDEWAMNEIYLSLQAGLLTRTHRALTKLAFADTLTGVGNRRALLDSIGMAAGRPTGLLFLDLDRFKQLNDIHGHESGDRVLEAIASRLRDVVHAEASGQATVYRLGGDEFVVLVNDPSPTMTEDIADAIVAAMRKPIQVNNEDWPLAVSIGAVADTDGTLDAAELLRRGDVAMYSAKNAGGARFAFYSKDESRNSARSSPIEQRLHRALANDEFLPAFQPVVSLAHNHAIVGAEALLRWPQASGETTTAEEFLALAEELGIIADIDHRVLEQAVTACAEQLRNPLTVFRLSVNVSGSSMVNDYVEHLRNVTERFCVDPTRIMVELTELSLVTGLPNMMQALRSLRQSGVHVAIDDFGTGYSSLAHLRDLPVDVVKLSRAFVQIMGRRDEDHAVARWTRHIVEELDLGIIADGVETETQERALSGLGYDWVQGFRYGNPEPSVPGTAG